MTGYNHFSHLAFPLRGRHGAVCGRADFLPPPTLLLRLLFSSFVAQQRTVQLWGPAWGPGVTGPTQPGRTVAWISRCLPPTYALNSCVGSSVWTFSCLTDLLGSPIFIARERDINFQLKVFKPDSLPHLERWVSCLRVTTPAWMIPEDPTLWGNRPSTPAPWDVLTPSFCLIVSSHGSKPKPLFKQFFLSSFPFFHCF